MEERRECKERIYCLMCQVPLLGQKKANESKKVNIQLHLIFQREEDQKAGSGTEKVASVPHKDRQGRIWDLELTLNQLILAHCQPGQVYQMDGGCTAGFMGGDYKNRTQTLQRRG